MADYLFPLLGQSDVLGSAATDSHVYLDVNQLVLDGSGDGGVFVKSNDAGGVLIEGSGDGGVAIHGDGAGGVVITGSGDGGVTITSGLGTAGVTIRAGSSDIVLGLSTTATLIVQDGLNGNQLGIVADVVIPGVGTLSFNKGIAIGFTPA